MVLSIIPVSSKREEKVFLGLPYALYADDPVWRAPLRLERAEHINPDKNPALATIRRQLFLAKQDGKWVGRIAAFINSAHQERYKDNTGHFGFLDCIPDAAVANALLLSAEQWLLENGADKAVGPAQWSVNEECGMLVDGYEHPAVVLMPHGREDYKSHLEARGYEKAVDMLAFQADLNAGYPRPKMARRMREFAENDSAISVRSINLKDLHAEIELALSIFNDAWNENWGFVPYSADQVNHMAESMKPILSEEGFLFGFINNEPVAFVCLIPDLNEAARGFNGRLLPFNWAKLLWRVKVKKTRQSRIPLMGLRREWHNTRQGLALVALLCEVSFENARDKLGHTHCELSWILEDNRSMIRIAEQASAVPYKTYRMYEKAL